MPKKQKRTQPDTPPSEELEPGQFNDGGPHEAPERDPAEAEAALQDMSEAEAGVMNQFSPESPPVAEAEQLPAVEQLGPLQMASELERTRRERQEFLDGWQRARAEFANYRKRVERDQLDARARIAGETLLRALSVLDDLERALKDRPTEGEAAAWADGIELIYRKFQAVLEAEGVQMIQAEGQSFDPALHEALSHEESDDHREGDVIGVVQRGYCIGDRVLRPALVRVAK